MSSNPSRGLANKINLVCSNSCDKIKKKRKRGIHAYKIIFLVINNYYCVFKALPCSEMLQKLLPFFWKSYVSHSLRTINFYYTKGLIAELILLQFDVNNVTYRYLMWRQIVNISLLLIHYMHISFSKNNTADLIFILLSVIFYSNYHGTCAWLGKSSTSIAFEPYSIEPNYFL